MKEPSCTLEAIRHTLPTVIQQQAQRDRDIEVDPEDARFDGSAEADGSLEVGKAREEATARGLRRCAHDDVDQVIQQVGAHAQFQGIPGARGLRWLRVRVRL